MSELVKIAYETVGKEVAWTVLPLLLIDMVSGKIIHVTSRCAAKFGYDPDELTGLPVEVLLPEESRGPHEKYRLESVKVARTDVANGNNNPTLLRTVGSGRMVRGLRKDRSLFPIQVRFACCSAIDTVIGLAMVVDLIGLIPLVDTTPVTTTTTVTTNTFSAQDRPDPVPERSPNPVEEASP